MTETKLVKLGEVAEFIRGITFKPTDVVDHGTPGAIVCMRTSNVQETLEVDDVLTLPAEFVNREEQYLREGDMLVSSANSWNLVGKACWVPRLDYRATAGGFISILRAMPGKVDARYLYRWFTEPKTQTLVRNCGRQTTNISNLSMPRCLSLELPLPPLAEQKRIAAVLDKADALRAKRRHALAALDTLLQSIFLDMFGDPVSNPKGWPMNTIGGLALVATGTTPSRADPTNYGGTIPWVKTTEVDGSMILDTEEHLTEHAIQSHGCRIHPKGSIVVALYGQGKTRGQVAMLGVDAATNQACALIYPDEKYESLFLYELLCRSYERLRAISRGGNQQNLNLELIRSFPVPLPPMTMQREFAQSVRRVHAERLAMQRAMAFGDSLFTSIQGSAFAGTLFDRPSPLLKALAAAY